MSEQVFFLLRQEAPLKHENTKSSRERGCRMSLAAHAGIVGIIREGEMVVFQSSLSDWSCFMSLLPPVSFNEECCGFGHRSSVIVYERLGTWSPFWEFR